MTDAKRMAVWVGVLLAVVLAGDRLFSIPLDRLLLASRFRYSTLYRGGHDASILVIGDSRGVHSFYAPALERITGERVLNLSYNSMSAAISEALVADYLERNRAPRLVLIEVTHLDVSSDLATQLSTYAGHSPRLRALYARSHPHAAAMGRWLHLLTFNSEFFFRSLHYLRRSDQDWINRGTVRPEVLTLPGTRVLHAPNESLDALARTVRRLRARGVTVRLILAPYVSPERVVGIDVWMQAIQSRTGLPVLNYVAAGGPPANFADRVHMNQVGAEALALRLAKDGVLK